MNLSKQLNLSSITDNDEIRYILDNGKKYHNKFGLIFLYLEKGSTENKAAVLVKKKCGNAVKRNYIKRIVRHIVRKKLEIIKPFNRIIFLFLCGNPVKFKAVEESFILALKRK